MADDVNEVESGEEEAAPKRKRRAPAKRKPRKPAATQDGIAAPSKKAAPKKRASSSAGGSGRGSGCVTLAGNTITCEGKGVRVRFFDGKQHGLSGIEGSFETPCTTPVKLRFRTTAAATKFFRDNMLCEDPSQMLIAANDSVDWDSDIFGG